MTKDEQDEQKKQVGISAVDTLIDQGLIHSGMSVGLGTGSTAIHAVRRIGELLASGTLRDLRAVVTSFQTEAACEELGIPVYSLNAAKIGGALDLAIDGADEITPEGYLIKGGGAALLREKIVAYNAAYFVIIADSSKRVPHLGTGFPLPVEIIGEARVAVQRRLEALGASSCTLREGVRKCGPVITDNGHLLLDVLWRTPVAAATLEDAINVIPGVVENGFFTKNPPKVFIAGS